MTPALIYNALLAPSHVEGYRITFEYRLLTHTFFLLPAVYFQPHYGWRTLLPPYPIRVWRFYINFAFISLRWQRAYWRGSYCTSFDD